MEPYETIRAATLEALDAQDFGRAFATFRTAIEHSSQNLDGSTAQFVDAFALFARISGHLANEAFAAIVQAAADRPGDINVLSRLGEHLYDADLYDIAATVLARADALAPGETAIVTKLAEALESSHQCAEAVQVLRRYPAMTGSEFFPAYLLAFNSLMTGDLTSTGETLATLPPLVAGDEEFAFLLDRMRGFLRRADRIGAVSPLDHQDLRGWHYVTTGGLLTHLSPYGFPDPMHGRYAMTQDSHDRIHHGICNLQRITESKGLNVDTVVGLNDRASQITARAAARMLGKPFDSWSGSEPDCLVVAYDLSSIDLTPYKALRDRKPGQLLFSHALNWVTFGPIAPDVVTLLYQYNDAPWEPQLRVNANGSGTAYSDPDERATEVIADDIVAADQFDEGDDMEPEPPELSDVLLDAIEPFPAASGLREMTWENSPVASARFL